MKRLYRALLRVYPPGFREEYSGELERQFADEYREAEGFGKRVRLSLRALMDLAATAPAEIVRELRQDLRYAARVYRKRTAATALAVASLALAIGATTGIFSVLNALLIRTLPFREPQRLVEMSYYIEPPSSGSKYLSEAARSTSEALTLAIGGESFRVMVSTTTGNFLQLLGIEPELGRGFSEGEAAVAVIGYGLWRQAFGGNPHAIGSVVRINGEVLTVVGVAPPDFDFPSKTEVWRTSHAFGGRDWVSHAIGRLKPGISFKQASALYRADVERLKASLPQPAASVRDAHLTLLQNQLAGPVRPASLVLMALMVFLLLIACANLAHLLLSRTTDRRNELAIRAALGASRARLTRQLITEATVLTAAAAIAGLAVAEWIARLAAAAQPAQLASRQYSILDWRVIVFALGLAAVTGIFFGALPASLIGRMQPGHDVLRSQLGSRSSSARRMRAVLIAAQAALTVTLAAGSFSMGRSFLKLMGIDLGFRTSQIVTMSIAFPWTANYRSGPFTHEALQRVRAIPGVESAGAASYLPLVHSDVQEGTLFKFDPAEPQRSARVMLVTPDYFRTMGTPLIEGREFTESDRRGAAPVVLVTEDFAQHQYPHQRLTGRQMYLEPAGVWAMIVGVVRAQRFNGPESGSWEVIYRPMDQYDQWSATFVAKIRGNPAQYLAVCRDAIQDIDRSVPVFDVKTLDQRLADAVAGPRFYTTATVFLASLALLLASIGAYGVASQSVSQRRHEIGIRIAVGGPPGRVRGMILCQSMMPVVAGVAVGLTGAAGLSRFLTHLMASVQPTGALLCTSAALAIVAASACAIWTATRRIIRTDPAAALRTE